MNDVLKTLSDIGIVPVIAIDDADKAVSLAKALCKGGLPAAEVTFRTAAGEESIRRMSEQVPDILVGAGTVLNIDQCERALAAGAKYIVSPGYNDELVAYCIKKGVPVLPGCVNASDITKAVNAGLRTVKFFPAEQAGGVKAIKALAPVFPVNFMPTGGVNTGNVMDYLSFDRIIACGGTWMVKKDLIANEKWDEIESICADAVKTMLGFSLHHIGINCENAENAEKTAKLFCNVFGFDYKPGNSSDFAAPSIECVKENGKGTNGHIAIGTNSVDRAVYHLSRKGILFDESTRKTDANGKTKAIYLDGDFGGFRVHLVQK